VRENEMEVRKSAALCTMLQTRPDESRRLAVFRKNTDSRSKFVSSGVKAHYWIVEISKLCPIHTELQSKGEAAERP